MIIRLCLTALCLGAWGAVIWWVDPMVLQLLCVFPFLLIAFPCALLGILLFAYSLRGGRFRRPALMILSTVGGWALIATATVWANDFAQRWPIAEAKAYPQQVEPLLEAYRVSHGAYPKRLDQLPAHPKPPRLMRESGYQSDGSDYSFTFPQPGDMTDLWIYDRATKRWELST